ncbi:MAG TPA: ABC transporter permease subunit [Gemmataceae bacterium]|nr:ABC transporter permease subunit [Gemmataceae bacterium]
MSIAQACYTWLRQTVGWSNSRQSWEERIGVAILIAGAVGLWVLGSGLSAVQIVLLWCFFVLAAAILLRRGWLKLFGPVLFYDMVTSARRARYFALRCSYAGLLLLFLFIAYVSTSTGGLTPEQQAGRFAQNYFETFMVIQILAVMLLTPAYVAGSVADEKVKKTLEFLLATDLRNREIVLSKLLSRLANLTLFVLTGLPILSLIMFLGGVDPNLVMAGFAATALTMGGLGGLSILNSVSFKRPRDSVTMTYMALVAYLALSFLLQAYVARSIYAPNVLWNWFGTTLTVGDLVNAFNSGNIFLSLPKVSEAARLGTLATEVPILLKSYGLFHGIIFAAGTILAVLRLRRVALKQMYGKPKKTSVRTSLFGRPSVGNQPMLWKEFFVEGGFRFNILAGVILALLLFGTLMPGLIIVFNWMIDPQRGGPMGDWFTMSREMNVYIRLAGTGVAFLLLLGVAVRASTSISSERDRQTFDALLTTPIDSSTILWSKWLGSVLSFRLGWAWLALIYGMGIVTGGLNLFSVPLLLASWFVYAAVFAVIGLWFSMSCRSTMRATVLTLFTVVGLSIGHWLICLPLCYIPAMGGGRMGEDIAKFQAGITPPAVLGILAFSAEDFRMDFGRSEIAQMLFYSLFGVFLWAVAGLGFFFGVVNPRFRTLTGRQDFRTPEQVHRRSRSRPPPERYHAEPRETVLPKNVILLEEIWEKPPPKPRELE